MDMPKPALRLSPRTRITGWRSAAAEKDHARQERQRSVMTDLRESDTVLASKGLTKKVTSPEGTLTIVDDIDLSVARGESLAIVGASGAGKSTLLALLAGLDLPTAGEAWLDGLNLTEMDEDGRAEARAGRVGFVFQSFHLVPSLTALENVMLPLELAGGRGARDAAVAVLDRVGLSRRLHHYPRQLSGGERQRVAIARAFVAEPVILFADEPTGNLDAATGKRIVDLLFSLNAEKGATLVLVTHDQSLAQRCDRVIQLAEGRLA